MPKEKQAHPDDERTPEQWEAFNKAEEANQRDRAKALPLNNNPKLQVQNGKHSSSSTSVGEKQNG